MRIIYMGTPGISVECLKFLLTASHEVVMVVTKPDVYKGRGRVQVPVELKNFAIENNIPVLTPAKLDNDDFLQEIASLQPDLIVVVAFQILPQKLFTLPKFGTVNLHGSLLPKYRGAAPINRAIMAGETETGVSIFCLSKRVDCGGILLQKKIEIGINDTAGDVAEKMINAGGPLLLEAIKGLENGSLQPNCQDEAEATRAPKIFTNDTNIIWEKPAKQIHDLIRGLSPLPGARTLLKNKNVKIYRSELTDIPADKAPGSITLPDKNTLYVHTQDNLLSIIELQREGKARLKTDEFLCGFHSSDNPRFTSIS